VLDDGEPAGNAQNSGCGIQDEQMQKQRRKCHLGEVEMACNSEKNTMDSALVSSSGNA